jgi:hypothetical protein
MPQDAGRERFEALKVHAEMTEMFVYAILLGGLEHFFFHILGMSSSQLTFIFFSGMSQLVGVVTMTIYTFAAPSRGAQHGSDS